MILAQLSDPHIRLPPDDEGSGEALAAAVRAVLALDRRPDALVVTGDLADGGLPEEYARVRTAGKWAHAYYDGRLRIPIGPWPGERGQLELTLRHELTHAFLRTLHPQVPLWANEGYAQLFEGRPVANARGVFSDKKNLLPPEVLENAFTRDDGDEATIG